jgi:hypothetical protein
MFRRASPTLNDKQIFLLPCSTAVKDTPLNGLFFLFIKSNFARMLRNQSKSLII